MKILVLNPILYTNDGRHLPRVTTIKDTMIYAMCMGWARLGHQVTLVAADDYRPTQPETYDFDVRWMPDRLHGMVPSALPLPQGLGSLLRNEASDFDMIVTSEAFALTTLMASRTCGSKTLVWQELSQHQRKWHRWPSRLWHRVVVRWCFGPVRCVVGRSWRARDFIAQYMSPVAEQVVDHGIDLGWLPTSGTKHRQFLAIGQLIDRKRTDLIIDRFAHFCTAAGSDGYDLLIAGRGPNEGALKAQAARLGIAHRVKFLGFVSHAALGQHLAESAALLVATEQDLNMVSITESVACGTPVVTNTVPNTSPWIAQHGLGIVDDNWGTEQMLAVATDDSYAQRCLAERPQLSCEASAQRLIDLFNQYG